MRPCPNFWSLRIHKAQDKQDYKSKFYSQGIISKTLQEEGKRILPLGSVDMILLYLSWILRDMSWAKGNRARQEGSVQSVRTRVCVCVPAGAPDCIARRCAFWRQQLALLISSTPSV